MKGILFPKAPPTPPNRRLERYQILERGDIFQIVDWVRGPEALTERQVLGARLVVRMSGLLARQDSVFDDTVPALNRLDRGAVRDFSLSPRVVQRALLKERRCFF